MSPLWADPGGDTWSAVPCGSVTMHGSSDSRRTISLTEVLAGHVPDDFEGVRWPDGMTECRYNLSSADYEERIAMVDGLVRDVGTVLTGEPVDCDSCASKCSAG